MKIKYLVAVILVGSFVCGKSYAQSKPTYGDLRKIAGAIGQVAADFEACGSAFYAKQIKSRFEIAIIGCVGSESSEKRLLDVVEATYEQRSADIKEAGSSYCKGDNRSRYELIREKINELENKCDKND